MKVRMRKIMMLLLAASLSFTSIWCVPAAAANELDKAKDKKQDVDNQIKSKTSEQNKAISDKKKLESDMSWVVSQKTTINQQYDKLLDEIAVLDGEIEKLDVSIAEAEKDYEHQKELLKKRLRILYQTSNETIFDLFIKSKDVASFLQKVELISSVSRYDKQLMEAIETAKKDIEYKKSLREQAKRSKNDLADAKLKKLNQLEVSRADLDNAIRAKAQRIAEISKQLDDLEKMSRQLEADIKSLQSKMKYIGGDMKWPVPSCNTVVSYFGNRLHPILKTYRMHTGIDIDAKQGASIVAANSGTVIIAEWRGGYGNAVIIDHGGGITTLYGHASKLLVKKGQKVTKGQVIALVGSTGLSTGPHLHFEIRKNGEPVDPLKFGK